MPEYRDVKRPARLVGLPLTDDRAAIVVAGGNEAAIGTDVADEAHAGQLDLWYRPGVTLVVGKRNGEAVTSWSFLGHVRPEDCRTWYLAQIGA